MLDSVEKFGRKIFNLTPEKAFTKSRARTTYQNVRNRFTTPKWLTSPQVVQLDLSNYCNLWLNGKGCVHCNVKPSGGWNIPRGTMSDEMVKFVINYWGSHGKANTVAPYLNGEPLMEYERLRWINDLCEQNGLFVIYDTNGTLFNNRLPLIHRNVRQVRFTLSATSREMYETVHGADLFIEAKKTVNWFLKNRLECQYPMLYFICNRYNKNQLFDYVKEWSGKAHIVLFPLHESKEFQHKSEESKFTLENEWNEITYKLTGKTPKQANRPIDVCLDGKAESRYLPYYMACQVCESQAISWNGLILHCTDLPYKFNYGHVYDCDMLKAWTKRNVSKLTHPACRGCNVKHPNHDKIIKKHLKMVNQT